DCDSSQPHGCQCCLETPSTICCDIHTLSQFTSFFIPAIKPIQPLPRTHIPKMNPPCEFTQDDRKLQQELEHWHKNKTIEVFGCSILVDMGPSLAMPSEVLDHIVECIHLKVIKNVNQLICEICWADAEEYGESIIAIIQTARPDIFSVTEQAPPLMSVPLPQPLWSTTPNSQVDSTVKHSNTWKCSHCGECGHTCE
ncbi:hypothetical protein BDQ17DRAFT_1259652, partial [Cyathus striatus]